LVVFGRGNKRGAGVKSKSVRGLLGVVVGLLALVGVGASATHYLFEPYNPGFLEYPTIVALHVVLGGLYLALAPFQFVRRIRSGHLGYHRWAGRVLVSIGLVIGATALFMGMFIPIAGWVERGYIGVFGVLFLVALVKGFVHVRAGRVAQHREWMIRAFAIGLAVPSMRLIFVPALLIVADPTQGQVAMLSAASFLTAFVLNSSLAEVWIRLTRRSAAPGTRTAGSRMSNESFRRSRDTDKTPSTSRRKAETPPLTPPAS
jgi:uncharacterized membrane protein